MRCIFLRLEKPKEPSSSSMAISVIYPTIFLSSKYDAIKVVDRISPRPIFFIHGDADKTVPVSMSRALYEAAKEPKELWIVPGAAHLECHKRAGDDYVNRIVRFFLKNLSPP